MALLAFLERPSDWKGNFMEKKIKVLFYDNGFTACTYLRGRILEKHLNPDKFETRYILVNEIKGQQIVKDGKTHIYISEADVKWADIVVFERFYSAGKFTQQNILTDTIKKLVEIAKDHGKKIVYEVDDLVHGVDPHNPSYEILNRQNTALFDHVDYILANCDLITVTTEILGEEYKKMFNKPYAVCPNSIDLDKDWNVKKFDKGKKLRIGWSGGNSHIKDIEMISDVLKDIAEDYQDRIQLVFMGHTPTTLDHVDIEYHGFIEYDEYPQRLAEINLDIGLCPLEAGRFNESKSNIKWIEYSALNIATVASAIPPYSNTIENGKTGLLVKNRYSKWYNAIKRLIEDDKLRNEIAQNAYNEINKNYNIKNTAKLWEQAYIDLLR